MKISLQNVKVNAKWNTLIVPWLVRIQVVLLNVEELSLIVSKVIIINS